MNLLGPAVWGFLGGWLCLIVAFYALLEHKVERRRLSISLVVAVLGVPVGWLSYNLSADAIAFLVCWLLPCVLHALFGRAPGMAVLDFVKKLGKRG